MSGGGETSAGKVARTVPANEDVPIVNPEWLKSADFVRHGADLHIEGSNGHTVIVEGYFSVEPQPSLYTPGGQVFPPSLIKSFILPEHPGQYAGPYQGASPVGVAEEVSGEVTVTRVDGTVETVERGSPIFEGDVIETSGNGAVNILFIDETSFAISDNARLAIDEYVFDPDTGGGVTGVSMLRGLFIFTSGLIAREDPDDVTIGTPMGSIGIRGTVIAGNVDAGEYTVVEGAIVVRTPGGHEITMAKAFETIAFNNETGEPELVGTLSPAELNGKFFALTKVAPSFFASIGGGRGNGNDQGEIDSAPGNEDAAAGSEPVAGDEPAEVETGPEAGTDDGAVTTEGTETTEDADGETGTSSEDTTEETRESTTGATADGTTETSTETGTTDTGTGTTTDTASDPSTTISASDSLATDSYGDTSNSSLTGDSGASTDSATDTSTDTSTTDTSTSSGDTTSGSTTSSDPATTTTNPPPSPPPSPPPPTNAAPSATDAGFTVNENSPVTTSVGTVAASDPEGGTLTYSISAGNADGAFSIDASTGTIWVAGSLNYELAATRNLTVTVTDGGGLSDTAAITVNVADVTEAAVLDLNGTDVGSDRSVTFTEGDSWVTVGDAGLSLVHDESATVSGANVTITNLLDGGNEQMWFTTTANISSGGYVGGTLTLIGTATLAEYETALKSVKYANYSSNPDTTARVIEVLINDGAGGLTTQTTTVSIIAVNDAPVAANDSLAAGETGTTLGNVLTSGIDTDPEGDALGVSAVNGTGANVGAWVSGSDGGQFQIAADGSLTFDPGLDFDHLGVGDTATTSISYTVSDGNGGTDTATVTVTVNGEALNLNTMNNSHGFRIWDTVNAGLGDDFSAAGDMDGDGYFNLLVAGSLGDAILNLTGRASPFVSDSATSFNAANSGSFLASINANFAFAGGANTNPVDSVTVSYVGDFDGDGDADFVVGAYSADSPSAADSGQVFVMDAAGNKVLELNGLTAGDWLGESVAGIGDVNGDGFADILVGAPGSGGGDGSAYILFGHPVLGMPGTVDVADLGTGISGTATSTNIADGFVLGNYLYTASNEPGPMGYTRVWDISNPDNPVEMPQSAGSSAMTGMTSVFYDSASGRLIASSYGSPDDVVKIKTDGGTTWLNYSITDPIDTLVLGNRGYILTAGNHLHFIDDFGSTPPFDSLNVTPLSLAGYAAAEKIETDGESIYVLTDSEVIKIDPAGTVQSSIALSAGCVDIAIDVAANVAYVANASANTIEVVDLATMTFQTTLDLATMPEFAGLGTIRGVYAGQVAGNSYLYAITNDGVSTGTVAIFDLTDPAGPRFVSSHTGSDAFMYGAADLVAASDGTPLLLSGGIFQAVDPYVEGIRIDGPAAGADKLGNDVAAAGDFNNDGYSDFAVSLPDAGKVEIYLGQSHDNSANLGVHKITVQGLVVAMDLVIHRLGDLNRDGISDIMIEDPAANAGNGRAHVIFGGAYAAGSSVDVTALGASGFSIDAGTRNILSVSSAGDFNGDGADDIAIIVKQAGPIYTTAEIYLVFGGDNAVWSDGVIDYAELTSSAYAYAMEYDIPAADPDAYEFHLSPAGDLNGDGFEDIAIGMPDYDDNADTQADGQVYVVYGRDTQTSAIVQDDATPPPLANESAHWKFDEGSGVIAADGISSNDGTLTNFGASPWTPGGAIRGSLAFDGIDDYVSVSTGPNIASGSFTISAWTNMAVSGSQKTILSHGTGGATSQLTLGFDAADHLFINFGGTVLTAPGTFSAGKWYNVALTYDSADNSRTLFVNGTAVATDTAASDFTGTGALDIGRDIFTASGYFDGLIDDVRIFDQALSKEDIESIASREVDLDIAAGGIAAGANDVSLVGDELDNLMHDNGMANISFRGGAGDDTINLTSSVFGDIDGGSNGSGGDRIRFTADGASLDFSMIGSEQVTHIEGLESAATNQTITLSFRNLFDFVNSSDTGTFKIDAFDATTHLILNSEAGALPDNVVIQQEFADMINAAYARPVSGYDTFKIGAMELQIDTVLFSGGQVEVV